MAKIYVNGDVLEVSLPLNVSELIQQNNVQQPEMVSVQVNEEFAEREDWDNPAERGRQGRFPLLHGRRLSSA